ncbi:MAG: 23S rRNA (pseudouridine(1915)-N(3))-methyltransferase RlmH [Hyphomicrobiaceae bacterium]|nr:23S rRNA (pseudouridine(1915)-N(3))-methyltransferase RlmH [Hyphomicrobiaceae bacterium]
MRLLVAAIGRLKDGAERELLARYTGRFEPLAKRLGIAPVTWLEFPESRAATTDKRCSDEAAVLLNAARDAQYIIALDVAGKPLSSEAFAKAVAAVRDGGHKTAAILIGGPDGFAPDVLKAAHLRVSLGAVTLPHALARIVLAEQLYRAATILSGHPYHRA